MSDVGVAPAPAPAAAPANEVPINPSPVNIPQPIGPQAPDKVGAEVKGSEHRPQSRREAIQRAFDKAEAERGKIEPAKARMGHNQPPEETKVERARDQPKSDPGPRIDLKKRPDDQPKDERPKDERPRAEHGHFAGRQQQQPAAQQQPARQELPAGSPYRSPPQRMADHAKAGWAATPESVRGEVHRMHTEMARAYQAYRGDHEEMNQIRPYHDMARQHGTTLNRALANYTSMEQKLRTDVIGGLDIIVNNLNLRTSEGQKLGLRDIAWHILNQSPEQHQLVQNQNAQTAQTHQIGQLHQMVNTLASGIQQMQYERKFTHTRSAIDQFADTHPRFDELGDLIEHEIKLGFDLDTAYRRAELLRPGTHAAQTRNGPHTAQTRTPDRSISGAPDGGPSNGYVRRPGKQVGRREAIANAMKRVNGSSL